MATAEAGAYEFNNAHYETSNTLTRYAKGGDIADYYSDQSNTGTSETDLFSLTTAANTLGENGTKLQASYAGTFNDATATAQLKVYFAGTVIGDSGTLTVSATGAWNVECWIIRTGSTTARAICNFTQPGTTTPSVSNQTDLTGLTLTGTNILKITGQAGGAGGGSFDITGKMGAVRWRGASF